MWVSSPHVTCRARESLRPPSRQPPAGPTNAPIARSTALAIRHALPAFSQPFVGSSGTVSSTCRYRHTGCPGRKTISSRCFRCIAFPRRERLYRRLPPTAPRSSCDQSSPHLKKCNPHDHLHATEMWFYRVQRRRGDHLDLPILLYRLPCSRNERGTLLALHSVLHGASCDAPAVTRSSPARFASRAARTIGISLRHTIPYDQLAGTL
jgi:hypothetical protein